MLLRVRGDRKKKTAVYWPLPFPSNLNVYHCRIEDVSPSAFHTLLMVNLMFLVNISITVLKMYKKYVLHFVEELLLCYLLCVFFYSSKEIMQALPFLKKTTKTDSKSYHHYYKKHVLLLVVELLVHYLLLCIILYF